MMKFRNGNRAKGSSRLIIDDGTPYTLKGVRTVWAGGKAGDSFKGLPISIYYSIWLKVGPLGK